MMMMGNQLDDDQHHLYHDHHDYHHGHGCDVQTWWSLEQQGWRLTVLKSSFFLRKIGTAVLYYVYELAQFDIEC